MSEQAAVTIRPAATVMFVRERDDLVEVYMLRRSARSAFVPDMYVFPGGAVDEGDVALGARLLREPEPPTVEREPSEPAFEAAALREAFEEAGILLAARRDGTPLAIDPDAVRADRARLLAGEASFEEVLGSLDAVLDARKLRHFSHWITPPSESRRFDTHFYLAPAPDAQHGSADDIETHEGIWVPPAEALKRNAAGKFPMIFPTIAHLQRLLPYRTLGSLHAFAATKAIHVVNPIVTDDRVFAVPSELEERW